MSTAADKPGARGLRDRPLGRILLLVAVLAAAFLVSRSCGDTGTDVSKEEAIEAARKQLDFRPECVQVRFGREGIKSRSVWRVSLWSLDAKGEFERISVVVVDAQTKQIVRLVRRASRSGTLAQCNQRV